MNFIVTVSLMGLSSGLTMLVIAYLLGKKGLKGLLREALLMSRRFRALDEEDQQELVEMVSGVVATELDNIDNRPGTGNQGG